MFSQINSNSKAREHQIRLEKVDDVEENVLTKLVDMENKPRKRRRVRVGDPDFLAPDGGWGWWIVVGCGIANISVFPTIQQFGLLFKERLDVAGITSTQATTIINLNCSFTSFIGLLNGPIFRLLTYRQVSLIASMLIVASLIMISYCNTFWSYVIFFSVTYGSALGLFQSGLSIAVNTYFHKRRRIATGILWTLSASGPCFWPHVITFLIPVFGPYGTGQIFAAIAANTIACSLLLQPVHWHTKFQDSEKTVSEKEATVIGTADVQKTDTISGDSDQVINDLHQNEISDLENGCTPESRINEQNKEVSKDDQALTKIVEETTSTTCSTKCANGRETGIKRTINKILAVFDFDLLKDITFLNLMLGMNLTSFAEHNFAMLTPFVLTEYLFTDYQIATFMTIVSAVDIPVRLAFPFVAEKLGWDNRIFYMFGISCMTLGRIVLIETQNFSTSIFAAIIIGFGKGLKTVFLILVLTSYVSLEKLPGAFGLQIAVGGVMFFLLGPLIGWIRDLTQTYTITLHLLNVVTYLTAISWGTECLIRRFQQKNENTKL